MNAVLRAKHEAPVLTNEAIEVHLSYLRAGFDSLQAALQTQNAKIDKANEDRAAGDATLSEKIDKLTEKVLETHANQKAFVAILSLSAVAASTVSIARTLNWI